MLANQEEVAVTSGEYLDEVEHDARAYRLKALDKISRNAKYYNLKPEDALRIIRCRKQFQRLVDALLADFINEMATMRGGDRGERVEHLK